MRNLLLIFGILIAVNAITLDVDSAKLLTDDGVDYIELSINNLGGEDFEVKYGSFVFYEPGGKYIAQVIRGSSSQTVIAPGSSAQERLKMSVDEIVVKTSRFCDGSLTVEITELNSGEVGFEGPVPFTCDGYVDDCIGCKYDDQCFDFWASHPGFRQYCGEDQLWKNKKYSGDVCSRDEQCVNGLCNEGRCLFDDPVQESEQDILGETPPTTPEAYVTVETQKTGIIALIIAFLKKLFGIA